MSIIGDYSEEFLFPKGVNEEKLRETMGLIMPILSLLGDFPIVVDFFCYSYQL